MYEVEVSTLNVDEYLKVTPKYFIEKYSYYLHSTCYRPSTIINYLKLNYLILTAILEFIL